MLLFEIPHGQAPYHGVIQPSQSQTSPPRLPRGIQIPSAIRNVKPPLLRQARRRQRRRNIPSRESPSRGRVVRTGSDRRQTTARTSKECPRLILSLHVESLTR